MHAIVMDNTHTHIHTYAHEYTHVCIRAYMHTQMHARIHAYMHTYVRACMHTGAPSSRTTPPQRRSSSRSLTRCACACACTRAYMHVHVHLHIYVHGSMRSGPTRCIHIYAFMHVYTPAAQHNARLSPSHKPGQELLLTITTQQPSPKVSWVEPDVRPIPMHPLGCATCLIVSVEQPPIPAAASHVQVAHATLFLAYIQPPTCHVAGQAGHVHERQRLPRHAL